MLEKACPVVLRNRDEKLEILAFRHPLAGIQLVKGSIEPGETSLAASRRELCEEAGLNLNAEYELLNWQRHPNEPVWRVWVMEPGEHLPDHWDHFCEDDGGHVFQFFWHSLAAQPSSEWHPVFSGALAAIREALVFSKRAPNTRSF